MSPPGEGIFRVIEDNTVVNLVGFNRLDACGFTTRFTPVRRVIRNTG